MRNGDYTIRPFAEMDRGQRAACACGAHSKLLVTTDDAWGCAMYGQSLFTGEGGAADDAAAAAAFEKSCVIDPDFDSCEFSQILSERHEGARPRRNEKRRAGLWREPARRAPRRDLLRQQNLVDDMDDAV